MDTATEYSEAVVSEMGARRRASTKLKHRVQKVRSEANEARNQPESLILRFWRDTTGTGIPIERAVREGKKVVPIRTEGAE
ncbi:MAG: hypothetical protein Q9226_002220 [Calogaya cf. arnoldii]